MEGNLLLFELVHRNAPRASNQHLVQHCCLLTGDIFIPVLHILQHIDQNGVKCKMASSGPSHRCFLQHLKEGGGARSLLSLLQMCPHGFNIISVFQHQKLRVNYSDCKNLSCGEGSRRRCSVLTLLILIHHIRTLGTELKWIYGLLLFILSVQAERSHSFISGGLM